MKVIIESIKYAAKAVHMVGIANIKCKNAYEAIPLTNKKEMWDVLQQYYKNYKGFINNLSNFTGYYIFSVDKHFYEQCDIGDIRKQLEIVVGFVYAKEVLSSAAKENFKQCLKKRLKQSMLFTDIELALL